jgi:hypothetical protein
MKIRGDGILNTSAVQELFYLVDFVSGYYSSLMLFATVTSLSGRSQA